MKAIVNGIILTEQGELSDSALLFNEVILGIVAAADIPKDAEIIDARGRYIAPGLVDVHIHGYVNEDVSDGSELGVRKMAHAILENGVTGFLPTTMTVAWEEVEEAFGNVRRLMPESNTPGFDGSRVLGCHAEGPFINPERKGAQSADHIIPPDADRLLGHRDVVRMVTISPEVPGGIDFIRKVRGESDIVVCIGHTSADYDTALRAIEAGASHITHLFNAMTGLNHRNPGVVGAALSTDVSTELIADTFHVHPGLFAMVYSLKKDRLVLVTDCTRAGGLPDGEYSLGGQPIFVKGIECRLADGTIAGSVLKLNDAVYNLHAHGGVPLHEAVHAASLSPARVLGEDHRRGSLKEGKDADIILMDDRCRVSAVFIGGALKYLKEDSNHDQSPDGSR